MMTYRSLILASLATALGSSLAAVAIAAAPAPKTTTATSPTLAPVVKPRAAVSNPTVATLENASNALHAGQWLKAAELYGKLVNTSLPAQRAQARYGLALAFSQLGQDDKAFETLEGTLRDDTPLGQAVGTLRARLVLQLADKALATDDSAGAARWLEAYDHLPDQPDSDRAARLKAALNPAAGEPATLNVGVMVPQTGPLKDVGLGVIQGLQMGLRDFDGQGHTRITLHVVDVSDTASAVWGAQTLRDKKVDVVVGPLLAPTVTAAHDVLKATHTPILALSSDRSVLGDGVFTVNYLPSEQARAVAQAAMSAGQTKVAVLAPQTPYGAEASQAFIDEIQQLGGKVVKSATYNPKDVDIGASIRTLMGGVKKGEPPAFDALFVPAPATAMPLVFSQLRYYDVDKAKADGSHISLYGTALWQHSSLLTPSASALRGSVFASPPQTPDFNTKFETTFGVKPSPLAVVGYDTARLLVDVARETRRTGTGVNDTLTRPEGFYGNGGYLKFTGNGETRRGLALVKVGEQFETVQQGLPLMPLVRE